MTEENEEPKCPKCGHELKHFSGLDRTMPEYDYCPICNDTAYDENGEKIAEIV